MYRFTRESKTCHQKKLSSRPMFMALLSEGVGRAGGQSIWHAGGGLPRSAKTGRGANEGDGLWMANCAGQGQAKASHVEARLLWGPELTPTTY